MSLPLRYVQFSLLNNAPLGMLSKREWQLFSTIFSSNKTWGTHTWQMTSEDCCWESSKIWYSNRNRNLKTMADWIDYWNHIHHCHWSNLRQFHRLDCEFWAVKIQFHPEIEITIFNFFFVKSISRIFSRKWFIFFFIF